LFVQCVGVYGVVSRINDDIVTKKFVDMELIKKSFKRKTKIKMGKSISKNMGRN
jgi:hypothetical protein